MRAALVPVRHFLFSASARRQSGHTCSKRTASRGPTSSLFLVPLKDGFPPPPPIPRRHMNTESPLGG